ncbi:hypothetical protein EV421DRAFT_1893638 [Armillaria borealis]|uniref:Helitron helicase-like domain-containing protein n=1 Tax=Armillaria borealis TaxID=47425 RepID=A0AA39MDQ6_9AGAR|nr:hypothetical protein EV421DRAFT_1893638 [Armillaria borealis]
MQLDEQVLESLSSRLSSGESVTPSTPAEKDCFQLFNDLDHVSYKILLVNLFISTCIPSRQRGTRCIGHTSSYYGAVEQQDRLTLHLHLIAWEIRDRLLEEDSEFQKQFVAYLESAHTGDYFNGTDALLPDYQDPTETLPVPPPPYCNCKADDCVGCDKTNSCMVNVHNCHQNTYVDGTLHNNKWGKCRGHFPWPLFESTTVDSETAHVNMKKREAWINTFTPILTYLLRCNTDVTSLRSGTAIKAVLIYPALKTHVFFDVIKSVFQRNKEQTNTTKNGQDQARKLMTQMVNVLGAKMEIGAPMIYHYTNCTFVTFYWKSFVSEVRNSWKSENEPLEEVKIQIKRKDDKVIGVSPVEDYMKQSVELESMCLYEWISRYAPKSKKRRTKLKKFSFLESHPLHDTHYISMCPEHERYVPNFVGGLLPRHDIGDRDYYCTTMLTLFKPWRCGMDLKTSENTWDHTFTLFMFEPWHIKLMSYFNLRYECLDAKDDYHAQLKQDTLIKQSLQAENI